MPGEKEYSSDKMRTSLAVHGGEGGVARNLRHATALGTDVWGMRACARSPRGGLCHLQQSLAAAHAQDSVATRAKCRNGRAMVWGQAGASGVADLVERLERNDPKLSSLTILRFRKFGPSEVEALCEALKKNTTLTELNATGHKVSRATAATLAAMLAENSTLTSLCVGDMEFGALKDASAVFHPAVLRPATRSHRQTAPFPLHSRLALRQASGLGGRLTRVCSNALAPRRRGRRRTRNRPREKHRPQATRPREQGARTSLLRRPHALRPPAARAPLRPRASRRAGHHRRRRREPRRRPRRFRGPGAPPPEEPPPVCTPPPPARCPASENPGAHACICHSAFPRHPCAHLATSVSRSLIPPAHPPRSAAGAEALLRAGACRLLTALDLSFCGMDGAAAGSVASGLLRGGCPLEALALEGNPLGPAGARARMPQQPQHPPAHRGRALPDLSGVRTADCPGSRRLLEPLRRRPRP